ncbi:Uncharacterised protein [Candidatus Burarchaeum australiense]|nr:Uncharacterised protein [Candidatus Burarchaeum australiense]
MKEEAPSGRTLRVSSGTSLISAREKASSSALRAFCSSAITRTNESESASRTPSAFLTSAISLSLKPYFSRFSSPWIMPPTPARLA